MLNICTVTGAQLVRGVDGSRVTARLSQIRRQSSAVVGIPPLLWFRAEVVVNVVLQTSENVDPVAKNSWLCPCILLSKTELFNLTPKTLT